jgi:molecular chaperone GrpE (heat shock protein)
MVRAERPAPSSGGVTRLIWGGAAVLAIGVAIWAVRSPSSPAGRDPSDASGRSGRAAPAGPGEDDVEAARREAEEERPAEKHAPKPTAQPSARTLTTAPPTVEEDPLTKLKAAKADLSESGTDRLIDQLTSKDEVAMAEAALELIRRNATRAIRPLARIKLEDAAGSGLSIIDALGRLGGAADGDEKTAAVERLLAMLESEKRRTAPETPGNLIQIYEALGQTRDPRAAGALERELLDPRVDRAPKVVIVQSLVWIGADTSEAALVAAKKQQTDLAPVDDFDAELRTELLGVIDEAIELL